MLKEYKFDKVKAMNHLESVHGKRLVSFHTGTAYYTGQPRLYWQFEGGKDEWANPNPELGGWAVGRLFFPKSEVVSLKVDVYADTFEFVVREPPQSRRNEGGRGADDGDDAHARDGRRADGDRSRHEKGNGMTVYDVLCLLDHEVWLRVRPPAGDDIVVWSEDWIGGSGYPREVEGFLGCYADGLRIEMHEDPERGDDAPMLVVNALEWPKEGVQ